MFIVHMFFFLSVHVKANGHQLTGVVPMHIRLGQSIGKAGVNGCFANVRGWQLNLKRIVSLP